MRLPAMLSFLKRRPAPGQTPGAAGNVVPGPGADGTPKSFDWSFRPFLLLGYATLAVLVLGLGGWGVMARIGGAVIATGTVEVQGNRQVVQHPVGGIDVEPTSSHQHYHRDREPHRYSPPSDRASRWRRSDRSARC